MLIICLLDCLSAVFRMEVFPKTVKIRIVQPDVSKELNHTVNGCDWMDGSRFNIRDTLCDKLSLILLLFSN